MKVKLILFLAVMFAYGAKAQQNFTVISPGESTSSIIEKAANITPALSNLNGKSSS